jgi:hypothetical protein
MSSERYRAPSALRRRAKQATQTIVIICCAIACYEPLDVCEDDNDCALGWYCKSLNSKEGSGWCVPNSSGIDALEISAIELEDAGGGGEGVEDDSIPGDGFKGDDLAGDSWTYDDWTGDTAAPDTVEETCVPQEIPECDVEFTAPVTSQPQEYVLITGHMTGWVASEATGAIPMVLGGGNWIANVLLEDNQTYEYKYILKFPDSDPQWCTLEAGAWECAMGSDNLTVTVDCGQTDCGDTPPPVALHLQAPASLQLK